MKTYKTIRRVFSLGASLGVSLPRSLLREADIKKGDLIILNIEKMILTREKKRRKQR